MHGEIPSNTKKRTKENSLMPIFEKNQSNIGIDYSTSIENILHFY